MSFKNRYLCSFLCLDTVYGWSDWIPVTNYDWITDANYPTYPNTKRSIALHEMDYKRLTASGIINGWKITHSAKSTME